MRRAHRRIHVLVWLILAPAVALGVYAAVTQRPREPVTELPDAIAEDAP
jgi:hypothetical protein